MKTSVGEHLLWLSSMLTGVCAAVVGRIAYLSIVIIISLAVNNQRSYVGSPLWITLMLLNLVGWFPYLLWGSLAGIAYSLITNRWGRSVAMITCLLCLWLNEMMWYQGGAYYISFRMQVFINLFSPHFWKEAGIPVLIWLLPHALSFLLMPVWVNALVPKIEAKLARR